MDVVTMRFIVILLIILVGLVIIPFTVLGYWIYKYKDKARWWMPVMLIIYLILFFSYVDHLIPERWSLKPVQVYHCEWQTKYEPKYPLEDK